MGTGAVFDNAGIGCIAQPICDACGSPGAHLYHDLTDHLFGVPGRWSIRQCANRACGLGWIDPRPVAADLGKLYETYYTHAKAGAESDRGAVGGGHYAGSPSRLKRLLRHLMPWRSAQFTSGMMYLEGRAPGRLIDVGCGAGDFLAAAAGAGWIAEGIDFDEKAIAAANALGGFTARVGDLDDAALEAGVYDAIIMNNVIEHVLDPAHAFARCATLLRAGGRLVMVTPNFEAFGRSAFGGDWRGLEIPRHLHLFTAGAMRRMAQAAGLVDVQTFSPIGGHGAQFMVDRSRQIARDAGHEPPSPNVPSMRLKAAIGTLLGIERGEFLVLVAHRSGAAAI